jgi:spore coat polysaccharide biosynthesis protein SpsF (cytidylyltransferase family)
LPTARLVIQEVLYRASKIKGVDVVIAALADDPGTDLLLPWISYSIDFAYDSHAAKIGVVRGPENDVLSRDLLAAKHVGADTIMRLTSDCPLLDPVICGQVLEAYRGGFVDYCTNAFPRTWPRGYDCEVFSIDLLEEANKYGDDQYPDNRQGVDVWMQASPDVRRLNITAPGESRGHIQWSLDEEPDYERIVAEFNRRIAAGGDTLCE